MRTTRDSLSLDEQVCFAMVVATRSVLSIYRPVLEPLGLTHPQYLVMLALWQGPPLSLKDLAGALRLDSATLSPLLKRLEAAGLVARHRDSADERSLAVELTESGRALRERALEVPGRVAARLGLSESELVALHTTLTHVISATGGGPEVAR